MAFGGNSSNNVDIKVTVDENGALKFFDALGKEMKVAGDSAKSASQGFSDVQANLVTLQSGLALATTAFAALGTAASIGIGAIRRGAEVDDISTSFEKLSQQAGVASDVLLNQLSVAVGGTISNFDLMKQANELLIGGISPDKFDLLAKAARSIGEATGKSAKEGMEALSDSLLKGNDRALKTLGIVIDNKKAEEEYAESLGKTRDALSEQEKVIAIREANLRALVEAQSRLGDVTDDAADRLDQFNASIQNAKDDFALAIANNEGLNEALSRLGTVISEIDIAGLATSVATLSAAFVDLANIGIRAATTAMEGFLALAKTLPGVKDAITQLEFEAQAEKAAGLMKRLEGVQKVMAGNFKTGVNAASEALGKFGTVSGVIEAIGLDKVFNTIAYEVDQAKDPFAEIIDPIGRFNEQTDKIIKSSGGAASDIKALGKAAKTELNPELEKAEQEARELDGALADLASNDWASALQKDIDAAKTGGGIFGSLFDSIFGDGTAANQAGAISKGRALGEQISTALADGLTQGIEGIFNGAKGEDYRKIISETVFEGLGAAADSYLPGSGQFVRAFEPLLGNALEHIFGGEHAGTTARKAADKFFADAFDANRLFVIIDGQLKQIEDLVFKGETLFGGNSQFTDGSFDNFFQGLPDAIKAGFSGVGTAFEEILGIGEDVGGQLAAVFANNVGGSLNNLQLLVQSTGKSFEEMKGAVVEAFLDGKISVLEAQTAINGLVSVFEDGIPGAVGATVEAFGNLQAAGSKGGRALIDAMSDIGHEAKELGIKDFGALAQNIIASGKYSTEEVIAYFDELRRQGIDNVEELTNATQEQLISVGSALQASGFLQEAANSTAELIDNINNLPSSADFTLNVKTNFDSNTRELLNSPAGKSLGGLNPDPRGVSVNS